MCFVIFRHGQNRNHCDTAVFAFQSSGSFIKRSQVGIHISWISATTRYFFSRSRNFTQCIRVVCDIGHDNQHMHSFFKSKIFCSSQSHTRSSDTFYCGVVCQIDKHYGSVDRACFFETFDEEVRFFKCNPHCCEDNGKGFCRSAYFCLSRNLSCKVCMRKTACGKDRQFLSSNQCVQTIDCRNTCLNKFLRKVSCGRIHRQTVDIHTFVRKNFRTVIDRTSETVKNTAEHIFRNTQFHASSEESDLTV